MNGKQKKVLVVSYNFPPMGGGGVTRIVKFCKFLPDYKWKPIALTVKKHDIPLNDTSLLKDIYETRIYRTQAIDLALFYNKKIKMRTISKNRHFSYDLKKKQTFTDLMKKIIHNFIFIPDSRIGWLPFAVFKGLQIKRKENYDLIFSTGGPWTNHLIGYVLKAFTKIPWIADFRDPWTDSVLFPYSFKLKENIERNLEKAVLLKADKIIATTGAITRNLQKKCRSDNKNKFYTVPNGYDSDEFNDFYKKNNYNNKKFTLLYTGNFYSLRTPKYFIEALALLFRENPSIKEEILVIFAGHSENGHQGFVKELNLEKVVRFIGFISRPRVIELLSFCNVTLLIDAKKQKDIYALKLFDYFASGKPILALIPQDGISASLIKQTRTGLVVDPENIYQIKNEILRMYEQFKIKKIEYNPNLSALLQFDRKTLTKNLSAIFNKTIRNSA